ncbi:hypothetical protein HH756_003610 [Escherichia coli]|nr:hypothetical protein [Escherichia coli]EFI8994617.1 hypothetical protein [Escherichia coli]
MLKVRWLGPRVNVKLTRGLSTSGLQVHPPAISRKAPTHNLRFLPCTGNPDLIFREC